MRVQDMERDKHGKLPAYTSIGCYTMIYLTADNATLCADCASKPADEYGDNATEGDVYWEGPPLQCEDCGAEIESAYGDPDDDDAAEVS